MDKVVASLRQQGAQCMAQAGDDAASANIATDLQRVDDLDVRLRALVLARSLPVDRWYAIAQTTSDDMAAQANIANSSGPSLSRFWNEVVAQSGGDVVDLAKKAKDALPGTGTLTVWLVLAVAGLIAWAVIKVS